MSRGAGLARFVGLAAVLVLSLSPRLSADDLERSRARARTTSRDVQKALERHYYDPAYRGVDLEARFRAAESRIAGAPNVAVMYGAIAQALADLHDPDTFFIPALPARGGVDYGWAMQVVGDACRIVAVRPTSAAEASGLKPGEVVYAIEGVRPTRETLANMRYSLEVLFPRDQVRLAVAADGQGVREVIAKADPSPNVRLLGAENFGSDVFGRLRRRGPNRVAEVGRVLVWKLGKFPEDSGDQLRQTLVRARRAAGLVLDLRGHADPDLDVFGRLSGLFTPGEAVAQLRDRNATAPVRAEAGDFVFGAATAVLVDSDTASVAEVLARGLQMKGKARIVGDRSAGRPTIAGGYALDRSTMRVAGGGLSQSPFRAVTPQVATYGVSLSRALLTMPDGSSLEGKGVVPDETVLPSGADLAAGRDPALARAIAIAGGTTDAAAAGSLFPRLWRAQ